MSDKEDIFAAWSSAVCLGVTACATVAYGEATMGYVCDRANLEWKLRQLADVRAKVSPVKGKNERNEQ